MTDIEQAREARTSGYARQAKTARVLAVALTAVALLLAFVIGWGWQQTANRATQQTLSLADQVTLACSK
ncbi:hypothetical protein, partial [Bacillus cereus]|uniref:hypothetical protein n=1 Tax=Bacillus cereus TaxID=1396 RepID=UPI0021126A0E|nr:hypothetical protein [Bacillus cereus]